MYILKKKAIKHSNKRISSFITSNSENQKKRENKILGKGFRVL